ncbi:hypothetical protein KBB96_09470 [Luteolibacter ambystomatis]|uniref:PDZ domain-containing protein n=1 Tax=Luteolibacter ambystomatis TaxID=2824561 RepID=A0A975PGV2_9BACT|nr:hypothetical protein [Luteolibacter ambystomatis]QUE53108.1 hypothetical protein KBB96_09470 [Luteolibacter ambystomatis]
MITGHAAFFRRAHDLCLPLLGLIAQAGFAALLAVWGHGAFIAQAATDATATAEKDKQELYRSSLSPDPCHFFVKAKLRDEDVALIVDTGARRALTFEESVAKTLGPALNPVQVNREVQGAVYKIPEVRIGHLVLPESERSAIDLSSMRFVTGMPVLGVVGWESLKGRTLVIDNDAHSLEIREGKAGLSHPQLSLPVEVEEPLGLPQVRAKVGDSEIPFVIDTGDNGCVGLSKAEFERLEAEGYIQTFNEGEKQVSVGGIRSAKSGMFTRGTIWGVDLKGLPVASNASDVCAVGLVFLLKLNYSISNSPSVFSCSVRANPEPPVQLPRMAGAFIVYRDGHAVIAKIKKGGPADNAGLAERDEIKSIDEFGDKPLNLSNLYEVCRKQAGKSLTLHLSNQGSPKVVRLELPAAPSAWEGKAPE